eukprot:53393-Eustigmatos_ZCMA.PRE.1
MGRKPTPTKPRFQHPISVGNITEVYWWGYEGEKSSGRLMVRAHACRLSQNRPITVPEHPPRPPGSSISPQI